jgi:penicillin-binding protein 1A
VVSVVWVGFDDMSKLGEGELAGNVALPLWIDYMHRVLEGTPSQEWDKPDIKEADLVRPVEKPVRAVRRNPDPQSADAGFQYDAVNNQMPAVPRRPPARIEIPEQLF